MNGQSDILYEYYGAVERLTSAFRKNNDQVARETLDMIAEKWPEKSACIYTDSAFFYEKRLWESISDTQASLLVEHFEKNFNEFKEDCFFLPLILMLRIKRSSVDELVMTSLSTHFNDFECFYNVDYKDMIEYLSKDTQGRELLLGLDSKQQHMFYFYLFFHGDEQLFKDYFARHPNCLDDNLGSVQGHILSGLETQKSYPWASKAARLFLDLGIPHAELALHMNEKAYVAEEKLGRRASPDIKTFLRPMIDSLSEKDKSRMDILEALPRASTSLQNGHFLEDDDDMRRVFLNFLRKNTHGLNSFQITAFLDNIRSTGNKDLGQDAARQSILDLARGEGQLDHIKCLVNFLSPENKITVAKKIMQRKDGFMAPKALLSLLLDGAGPGDIGVVPKKMQAWVYAFFAKQTQKKLILGLKSSLKKTNQGAKHTSSRKL